MNSIRTLLVMLLPLLIVACSTVSYQPVQEVGFDRLAAKGCNNKGERLSASALIQRAYRETIVLWDGSSRAQTVAVTLPSESIGSKARGVIGKSRYELSVERLRELQDSRTPITLTLLCEGSERTPIVQRFSYFENGQRIEFEF